MNKDNIIRITAGFVFLCCLLGCTVGNDFEKPQLYSNAQIEQALTLKPQKQEYSYVIFNDPILEKLQIMAFENSPSIKAAIYRVKQARLSAKIAEVKGLPTLDAAGQYQYVKESRNIGVIADEDIYQVGLDASWELDIFGGARRRAEAAQANAFITIANLENAYVSLAGEVALAYIGLRQSQTDLTIQEQLLTTYRAIFSHTQSLLNAGLITQDELNKADVNVQNTLFQTADIKSKIEQYKNQLALLTGQLPSALDDLLKPQKKNLIDKKFALDTDQFFNLSADVIENRPDVQAALFALRAQNATVGAAIAELYPKVSLSGMLGFQSLHFDKLFDHKSYTYSATPVISLPLFYFGQLKNQVKIEQEKYAESFATYENTFLTAAEEIKNALVSLQSAQKQYQSAVQNLRLMENIYRLAGQRRSAGLINQNELEQAFAGYLTALQSQRSANAALYSNVVRFFKSIGAMS